jgi:aminopeptidase N
MMQTLVGREGFAKGMKLYFERHDGQAVTCDDFAQAIADANPDSPLAACCRSSSAGTARPARRACAPAATTTPTRARYTLTFEQTARHHRARPTRQPFVIPVAMGCWPADGQELPASACTHLSDAGQRNRGLRRSDTEPVPSILRGFSAPVVLDFDYSDAQLLTLLAHDTDPFNRWEAGQRLALRALCTS